MPFDILNCQVVTVLTLSEFCDIFLWNKNMFNSKVILK